MHSFSNECRNFEYDRRTEAVQNSLMVVHMIDYNLLFGREMGENRYFSGCLELFSIFLIQIEENITITYIFRNISNYFCFDYSNSHILNQFYAMIRYIYVLFFIFLHFKIEKLHHHVHTLNETIYLYVYKICVNIIIMIIAVCTFVYERWQLPKRAPKSNIQCFIFNLVEQSWITFKSLTILLLLFLYFEK